MFLLDSSNKLNFRNSAYKKAVNLYVWQAYLNDMNKGDVTTGYFIHKKSQIVTAEIIAKESGILAGMMEAEWFLKKLGIRITQKEKEGSKLRKGDIIMKLKGRADKILGGERTLLNLLQHMSGVATATYHLSSKLPKNIKLLATRKTLWGDLDKRAVSVGGGGTHRLNLSDAILIKENHIALTADKLKRLGRIFKKARSRFIEVELENMKQVLEFINVYDELKTPKNLVVMLDNFQPSDIRKALLVLPKGILVEVSGGINEKNIKKYALKGVSAISSGAITNKAASLDFSLNILK
ncbi:carboxylating nicotinate-nucleotide diphosphorylase [candidate division KSB1 bacterium]